MTARGTRLLSINSRSQGQAPVVWRAYARRGGCFVSANIDSSKGSGSW
jgi:hypothetical protein